jgi:hypothetical protein
LRKLSRHSWALSAERARGALPFVAALAIALILWVVARGDRTFVVSQTVPVVAEAPPDSLVYLRDAARDSVTVAFTARGADVLLDQALGRPVRLSLRLRPADLSGPFPASVGYHPSEGRLVFRGRRYSQLSAESFSPEMVTLVLDRRAVSPRPVDVRVSGRIPARYLWTSSRPDTVTVRGPQSLVTGIPSVPTEPVPPDGSVGSVGLAGLDPRVSPGAAVAEVEVVSPICPLRAVSVR